MGTSFARLYYSLSCVTAVLGIVSSASGALARTITLDEVAGPTDILPKAVGNFAFSPDESVFAYTKREGAHDKIYAIALGSGETIELFNPNDFKDRLGAKLVDYNFWFSSKGTSLFIVTEEGRTFRFTLGSKQLAELSQPPGEVSGASVNDDENVVLTIAKLKKTLTITRRSTEREKHVFAMPNKQRSAIAMIKCDFAGVDEYAVYHPTGGKVPKAEQYDYAHPGGKAPSCRVGIRNLEKKVNFWSKPLDTDFVGPLNEQDGFTPDGREFLFVHLERSQKKRVLYAISVHNGHVRKIIEETDPVFIEREGIEDKGIFVDKLRFAYFSDREGYQALYCYDLDGNMLGKLTHKKSGDAYEVDKLVTVLPDTKQVVFSANIRHPSQYDLYSASCAEPGKIRPFLVKEGRSSTKFSPSGRYFVETLGSFTMPNQVRLRQRDGKLVALLNKTREVYNSLGFVKPKELKIKSPGGQDLYGLLYVPSDASESKKVPLVVYTYGGPYAQLVVDQFSGDSLFFQYLASQGLALFVLDNRGSSGRGKEFVAPIRRQMGKLELEDQIAGVQAVAKNFPNIDTTRLGIYGRSYGGFMTITALLKQPKLFKAGVAWGAPTDWRNYNMWYSEKYMGDASNDAAGYEETSLLKQAKNLEGKLLLMHGMRDSNVSYQHFATMVSAFEAADKDIEQYVIQDTGHFMQTNKITRKTYYRKVANFFLEHL